MKKGHMSQYPITARRFRSEAISTSFQPRRLLGWALAAVLGAALSPPLHEDGVALAIIYDTSGSMKEPVPDAHGGWAPKYQIANRALQAVTGQLQEYATNSSGGLPGRIDAGLFVFHGEHAREAVKLGPLDAVALNNFSAHFSRPQGNTPLGNALTSAAQAVLASARPRKHVLVITDGLNTAGPSPAAVLPRLKQAAERQQATVAYHFVAFDVDARQFAPLKRLGATVVGASDEKQLDSQLRFILQRKILLEDEEPPKTQ